MLTLFRAEFYRLLRSRAILAIFLCLASAMSFLVIKTASSGASTLMRFVLVISERRNIALFSIVPAAYMYCTDFKTRSFNIAVYAGYSRLSIFLSKLLSYYCTVFLLLFAVMAVSLTAAAEGWTKLGTGYLLRCFFIRFVQDLGAMSLPVLLAYLFRIPVRTLIIGLLYGFAMAASVQAHTDFSIFMPQYSALPVSELWLPVCTAVLSPVLSGIIFCRSELR